MKLSILLCFTLITGTFAVVSHEIDWLFNPAMRVDPLEQSAQLRWADYYQSAQSAFPNATILSIAAPIASRFAVEVLATENNGERFRIFINPSNTQVSGTGDWFNVQRFFRTSHRHLMLPTTWGITIVCSTAFLLLISFATGVVNYRRWWQGFFKPIRKKSKRILWGDIHRLLGVWSLWFILLIAVTGIWYLAERWGLGAEYPDAAMLSVAHPADRAPLSAAALQKLQGQVLYRFPALNVRQVAFSDGAVIFRGQSEALIVRDRANHVAFDATTGRHLSTRRAHDLGLHVRVSEAADPLHFGNWGGWITKVIWFLAGVGLSVLAVSGTLIYSMRVAVKVKKTSASDGVGRSTFFP